MQLIVAPNLPPQHNDKYAMCISRQENGQRDVPPCFERVETPKRRGLRRGFSTENPSPEAVAAYKAYLDVILGP